MSSKKALGPVVAVALLLVVGVTAVIGFQTWYQGYSSQLFTQSESQGSDLTTGVERVVGDTLYFKSNKDNMTITRVQVGNQDCNYQNSTQKGITQIDISSCLQSTSTGTSQEVVIYTDQGVFSEKFTVSSLNFDSSDFFISMWNTSQSGISNSNQIALPLTPTGSYNFTVSGDTLVGSPVRITSFTQNVLNFSTPGVHEILIEGEIVGWKFTNMYFSESDSDNLKILEIKSWGPLRLENTGGYFFDTKNLIISANDPLNLSGITNLSHMFEMSFSSNFEVTGTINNWDTSEIVDMSNMFKFAYLFDSPLNNWDVSNVRDMEGMFEESYAFNQPLNLWNTSQVENMGSMFGGGYSFSKMSFNQDISMWDVSNVVNMNSMFYDAIDFNQPLNSWNVSNLEYLGYMFYGAESFNQPLNSWNVSSIKNILETFSGATSFNQDISSWNVSNVTYMIGVFTNAYSFNQSLNSWDVSNVINMGSMFANAVSFNQPLDSWDTSQVIEISNMFYNATSYNQNISMWEVSQVQINDCTNFDFNTLAWIEARKPNFTSCTP